MSVLKVFHHTFHPHNIQRHQVLPIINAMCCSDWLVSVCRQRSGGKCLLTEFVLRLSDLLLTSFQPTTWRIMTFADIIIQEMTASTQALIQHYRRMAVCVPPTELGTILQAHSWFIVLCNCSLWAEESFLTVAQNMKKPFLPLNCLPIFLRTPIIFIFHHQKHSVILHLSFHWFHTVGVRWHLNVRMGMCLGA